MSNRTKSTSSRVAKTGGAVLVSFSLFIFWLTTLLETSFFWSRPYYYFSRDKLPPSSEAISANVIDYVLGNDEMRTGPFRMKEIRHLDDVKHLILLLNELCIPLLLANAVLAVMKRKRYFSLLRPAGKLGIFILLLFGLPALLFFDKFSYIFHLMFFRNIFWSLNPQQDLLIQVFPPTFFSFSLITIISSLFLIYLGLFLLAKFVIADCSPE